MLLKNRILILGLSLYSISIFWLHARSFIKPDPKGQLCLHEYTDSQGGTQVTFNLTKRVLIILLNLKVESYNGRWYGKKR